MDVSPGLNLAPVGLGRRPCVALFPIICSFSDTEAVGFFAGSGDCRAGNVVYHHAWWMCGHSQAHLVKVAAVLAVCVAMLMKLGVEVSENERDYAGILTRMKKEKKENFNRGSTFPFILQSHRIGLKADGESLYITSIVSQWRRI